MAGYGVRSINTLYEHNTVIRGNVLMSKNRMSSIKNFFTVDKTKTLERLMTNDQLQKFKFRKSLLEEITDNNLTFFRSALSSIQQEVILDLITTNKIQIISYGYDYLRISAIPREWSLPRRKDLQYRSMKEYRKMLDTNRSGKW